MTSIQKASGLMRADPKQNLFELVNGELLDPFKPDLAKFDHRVIATSLGNSCRFGGQVEEFYSTAQHSVLVAYLSPRDIGAQKMALFHDGDETLGFPDLITQVKRHFPEFKARQAISAAAIDKKFHLNCDDHIRIKKADRQALMIEKKCLKDPANSAYWEKWSGGFEAPEGIEIIPLSPKESRMLWLDAYERVFDHGLPVDFAWLSSREGFRLDQPIPELDDPPETMELTA